MLHNILIAFVGKTLQIIKLLFLYLYQNNKR